MLVLQLGFTTLADEDAAVIARDREAAEQAAAATKIQALHRGRRSRRSQQLEERHYQQTTKIQSSELERLGLPSLVVVEQEEAAIKIQAIQRGRRSRRQQQEALEARHYRQTMKIQVSLRCQAERNP
eukprot:COSAG05_NODE_974_length_6359_cov_3.906869_3_plen_127_part_00